MNKELELIFRFEEPTLNNRIYHQDNFISNLFDKKVSIFPEKIKVYKSWHDNDTEKNPIGYLESYRVEGNRFFGNCFFIDTEEITSFLEIYNHLNVLLEGEITEQNQVIVSNFISFSLAAENGYDYLEVPQLEEASQTTQLGDN